MARAERTEEWAGLLRETEGGSGDYCGIYRIDRWHRGGDGGEAWWEVGLRWKILGRGGGGWEDRGTGKKLGKDGEEV